MKPALAIAAVVGLIVLGSGTVIAADPVASTTQDPIAFVDGSTLSVSFDPEAGVELSKSVTVVVQNNTATDLTLVFSMVLTDPAGSAVDLAAPTPADAVLPALSVKGMLLPFKGNKDQASLSGFLVASAPGVSAATRPISISIPAAAPEHLARNIIVWAGIWGLVALVAATALVAIGRRSVTKALFARMGPAEFSSKESWATTIAGAGGLVSAIGAGTGFIPETTTTLTKGEFTALGLFFLAVPIVATLGYAALTTQVKGKKGLQEQGFVFTFLIAGALTVGSVVGQVMTLSDLVGEASKDVATSINYAFNVLLWAAVAFSVLYGAIQMRRKVIAAEKSTRRSATVPRTLRFAKDGVDVNVESDRAVDDFLPSWTLL